MKEVIKSNSSLVSMKETTPICAIHNLPMEVMKLHKDSYAVCCPQDAIPFSIRNIICPCCLSVNYISVSVSGGPIIFCSNPECNLYNLHIEKIYYKDTLLFEFSSDRKIVYEIYKSINMNETLRRKLFINLMHRYGYTISDELLIRFIL